MKNNLQEMKPETSSVSIPQSVELIANNIDLLSQILVRIPASTLIQFKLVSKQWHSLISDLYFRLSHTRFQHHLNPNSTIPTSLFLCNSLTSSPYFLVTPLKSNNGCIIPSFEIEQACNGLFVCSYTIQVDYDCTEFVNDNRFVFTHAKQACLFLICNSTTKECKIVKFPAELRSSVVTVNLAFDPCVSCYYKLVAIRQMVTDVCYKYKYAIDVYSSETDSWSFLGVDVPIKYFDHRYPIYCRNAIHWPMSCDRPLYFDFEMESLKRMPQIPYDLDGSIQYFGESRGRLHLVVYDSIELESKFDVLEMAMDYSNWFIKYRVNLSSIKVAFPELNWSYKSFWKNCGFSIFSIVCGGMDQKEESMIVLYVDGVVLAYNFRYGTVRKLCHVEPSAFGPVILDWYHAFPHFDTLSSL